MEIPVFVRDSGKFANIHFNRSYILAALNSFKPYYLLNPVTHLARPRWCTVPGLFLCPCSV